MSLSVDDVNAAADAIWQEVRAVLLMAIKRNLRIVSPSTGVETIYADDSVTPATQANVFEDVAGAQPYRGQGGERRDRRA